MNWGISIAIIIFGIFKLNLFSIIILILFKLMGHTEKIPTLQEEEGYSENYFDDHDI